MRKIKIIFLGGIFLGSFACAEVDVIALVSKGAVTKNTPGVKMLTQEEKANVIGGNYLAYGNRPYSFGTLGNHFLNNQKYWNNFNNAVSNNRPALSPDGTMYFPRQNAYLQLK